MDADYLIALGIVAAIYAAVFCGLGAYVAAQKHRSVAEGVILGGLFGPLGVLLVAILPAGVATSRRSPGLSSDRPPPLRIDLDGLAGDEPPKSEPEPELPPIAVRRIRKP